MTGALIRHARRRFGQFGLLIHPRNEQCSRSPVFLMAREYAKVRPKPSRPKLIKLTPAVRTVLQEQSVAAEEVEERRMSMNALKRRSAKALAMARLLATLTPNQIKNVIKWASLPPETYEATRAVQKMEVDRVHSAKRRQYNYLEGIIRHSRLDVLEYILQCVRCGQTVSIQRVLEAGAPHNEKYAKKTAETWVQGLIENNQNVCREVYSMPPDMLDTAELRNLMRELKLKLVQRQDKFEESEVLKKSRRKACSQARKALYRFLHRVALQDYEERVKVSEESEIEIRPEAIDILVQRMKAAAASKHVAPCNEDDSGEYSRDAAEQPELEEAEDEEDELEEAEDEEDELEEAEDEEDVSESQILMRPEAFDIRTEANAASKPVAACKGDDSGEDAGDTADEQAEDDEDDSESEIEIRP